MYIQDIKISGFIPFDTFGIESIHIDAQSIVQILIGDNGSGKSSILRELNPLPAQKSLYHKDGYKELTILHKDSIYKIKSSFEKKSGKHSFIKDDEELNIDGTSTLQTELAGTHLGYTSQVHNCISCKYNICQMSPSERKSLIMNLAPTTPEFIIDMFKYVRSKVREYKNNLTLLYTRKQEIENILIPKEEIDLIIKDKLKLEKSQLDLGNKIYHIEQQIVNIKSKSDLYVYPDVQESISYKNAKELKKKTINFILRNKINTDIDIQEQIYGYKNQLENIHKQRLDIVNKGKRIVEELTNFDTSLLTLKEESDISTFQLELKEKIDTANILLKNIGTNVIIPNEKFTDEQIAILKEKEKYIFDRMIPVLDDVCNNIGVDIENKFMLYGDFSNMYKTPYVSNAYRKADIEKNLNRIKIEIDKTKELYKNIPSKPSVILDNCNNCGYRNYYSNEISRIDKILENKQNEYKKYEEEYKKICKYLEEEKERILMLERNAGILEDTLKTLQNCFLRLDTDEVIHLLNKDPYMLLNAINERLRAIDDINTYIDLNKSISEISAKIKSLEKTNAPTIKILESLYNDKIKERDILRYQLESLNKEYTEIENKISILNTYKSILNEIENKITYMEKYSKSFVYKEYLKFLEETYLTALKKEKIEIDNQVFSKSKIIKEQESLQDRLTKEVITLIDQIEKKKIIYEYMEDSLSPESGMPKYHLVSFVNALISNANFVISKIWTTPLEIQLISQEEEFNCNFLVKCNNNQITKLENISKGQTAIVNFAFFIALMIALDIKDYPCIFDECDENLDAKHKQNYLEWLKTYIDEGYANQMWIVNHDAALYTGFLYKDIICLRKENVVVPTDINIRSEITYK